MTETLRDYVRTILRGVCDVPNFPLQELDAITDRMTDAECMTASYIANLALYDWETDGLERASAFLEGVLDRDDLPGLGPA